MKLRVFRAAREASPGWNIVKTLCQVICFWGFFLFVVPPLIVWCERAIGWRPFEFAGQRIVAVVVFVLCSMLGLSSAYVVAVRGRGTPLPMDAPRRLVISGPYRFVRNPMAVAGLGQGLAVGIWLGSWLVPVYVLAGAFAWNFFVRPVEERDLSQRFGEEYEQYRRTVRCWIPRFAKRR